MTDLRVIPGGQDRQPWNQRPGEDEAEYLLFLHWLHLPPPRPAPEYPAIAQNNCWTERANNYDSTQLLPVTPTAKAARGWRDLEDIFALEARKLVKDVKDQTGRLLTVKDLLTLGTVMADNRDALKRILDSDDAGDTDLTQLSDEELRALQEAQRALSKLGKGRK